MRKIDSDSENLNREAMRRLTRAFDATAAGHRAEGLLAKHSFKTEFLFEYGFAAVNMAVPDLRIDRLYSTEQLFGSTDWPALYFAEKSVAGMCLAYLVSIGAVGLELHRTPSGKGKKRYRLLSTQALVEMPVSRAGRTNGHGSAHQLAC